MGDLSDVELKGVAVFGEKTVIPEADYNLRIVKARTYQSKKGKMFNVVVTPTEGTYAGEEVEFHWRVVSAYQDESSVTAQNIGRSKYKGLCKAVGIEPPEDSSELNGHCFRAFVNNNSEYGNDIGKFHPKVGGAVKVEKKVVEDSDQIPF